MRMSLKEKTLWEDLSLSWRQRHHRYPMQRQAANPTRLQLSLPLQLVLLRLSLLLLMPLLLQMNAAALIGQSREARPAGLLYTRQLPLLHFRAMWLVRGDKGAAAATGAAGVSGKVATGTVTAPPAAQIGVRSAVLVGVYPSHPGASPDALRERRDAPLVARTSTSASAQLARTPLIRSGAAAAPVALTAPATAKDGCDRVTDRRQSHFEVHDCHGIDSFVEIAITYQSTTTVKGGVLAACAAPLKVRLYKQFAGRHTQAGARPRRLSFLVLPLSDSAIRKPVFSTTHGHFRPSTEQTRCTCTIASTRAGAAAVADVAAATSASASSTKRRLYFIDSASIPHGRPCTAATRCAAAICCGAAAARIRPRICTSAFSGAVGKTTDAAAHSSASAVTTASIGAVRAGTKKGRGRLVAAAHQIAATESNGAPTVAPPPTTPAATADGNAAVAGEASAPAASATGVDVSSADAADCAATTPSAAPPGERNAPTTAGAVLRGGDAQAWKSTVSGAPAAAGDRLPEKGGPRHIERDTGEQAARVPAGSRSGGGATRSVTPVALHALRPIVKGRVSAERAVPLGISRPFYALRDEPAAAALREMQHQEEQQQRREEAMQLRARLAKYLPISTREVEWVKTSKEIQGIRHACEVTAAVLQKAVDFVRDAADAAAAGQLTTDAIDAVVHAAALDYGAYPSPLRYSSFPKSVCTSVNEVICHGIPDDTVLQEGSVCSIDVSCYVGGFHGDCARTVTIGRPGSTSAPVLQLVATAEEATLRGVAACGPGKRLSVIGDAIESFLSSRGYCTIPYFCGHGIGRGFHEEPFVIHVPNNIPGRMLPGMCFTIEPVVCSGGAEYKTWDDKWTVSSLDGAPAQSLRIRMSTLTTGHVPANILRRLWGSAQFEHTVLITDTGVEILTPYPGAPLVP